MKAVAKDRYWLNSLALLMGNLFIAAAVFVATPELLEQLGAERYGLFRIGMIAFVSYMASLQLGFGVAARRYFADAYHDHGPQEANRVLGQSFLLFAGLAVLTMTLAAASAAWLPNWISLGPDKPLGDAPRLLAGFRWLLIAAGVWVACLLLRMPMVGVMEALGRFDCQQAVNASSRVLLYAGILAGFSIWGASLRLIAYTAIGVSLAEWLWARFLVKRVFAIYRPAFGRVDHELLFSMLKFSALGIVMSFSTMLVYAFPEILIGMMPNLGAKEVAVFGIAMLLTAQTRAIITAFSASLFPAAAKHRSDGDLASLRDLLTASIYRNLWLWGMVSIPLVVFSREFLSLWVGPEYGSSWPLVAALSLDTFGAAVALGANYLLVAAGSIRWLALSQLIASGAALIVMSFMLEMTSLGLLGIALAVGSSQFIRGAVFVPWYASAQFGSSYGTIFRPIFLRLLSFLALGSGLSCALRALWIPATWHSLLAELTIASITCFSAGAFLLFTREQRMAVLATIRRILQK
ncbi:MAG TPA: hypothetical protein EYN04_08380 [Porticoccaceae bacterium]|nr:hypothetical protein [Porticoccaceae bacterium]